MVKSKYTYHCTKCSSSVFELEQYHKLFHQSVYHVLRICNIVSCESENHFHNYLLSYYNLPKMPKGYQSMSNSPLSRKRNLSIFTLFKALSLIIWKKRAIEDFLNTCSNYFFCLISLILNIKPRIWLNLTYVKIPVRLLSVFWASVYVLYNYPGCISWNFLIIVWATQMKDSPVVCFKPLIHNVPKWSVTFQKSSRFSKFVWLFWSAMH